MVLPCAPALGKVTVSISIDPLLWREFKKACFENDKKYSHVVEQLVQEYVHAYVYGFSQKRKE